MFGLYCSPSVRKLVVIKLLYFGTCSGAGRGSVLGRRLDLEAQTHRGHSEMTYVSDDNFCRSEVPLPQGFCSYNSSLRRNSDLGTQSEIRGFCHLVKSEGRQIITPLFVKKSITPR